MNIIRGLSTHPNRNPLDPTLETPGIWLELRGGDYLDPLFDPDGWFGPQLPKRVLRFHCSKPLLPWFAWNLFGKAGYIGFKAYGVDSENYIPWAGKENVYPGSQALHFSARNGLTALWLIVPALLAWWILG